MFRADEINLSSTETKSTEGVESVWPLKITKIEFEKYSKLQRPEHTSLQDNKQNYAVQVMSRLLYCLEKHWQQFMNNICSISVRFLFFCFCFSFSFFSLGVPFNPGPMDIVHQCHPIVTPLNTVDLMWKIVTSLLTQNKRFS